MSKRGTMRGYFAYVYANGAHFEVHEGLCWRPFCHFGGSFVVKSYLLGSCLGAVRTPPKGARDASSPKVVVSTKSYKAKTHRQRTFFFTDFQGVQKGAHFEVHEGLFGIRIRKRSTC